MLLLRNPWFLLALALLPLIWWTWLRRGHRAAIRFSDVTRLAGAASSWAVRARYLLPALRTLAVALLILAIARPQKADEETRVTTEGVAIQLVVDRSGSMGQPDFLIDDRGNTQTRLDAVKDVIEAFIAGDGQALKGRPDDLIGLIAFARWPDTECPLTRDHQHLTRALKAIVTPANQMENSTAIGDALMLAIERIRNIKRRFEGNAAFKINSQVVVLLTDGEQNAGEFLPEQAAEVAASLGVKIYAIGAAPEFQTRQFGFFSQQQQIQVPIPFNEESLKKVAEMTGGKFWRAKDTSSLAEIYTEIDRLERSAIDETKFYQYEELAYRGLHLPWGRLPPVLVVVLVLLAVEVVLANTRFRKIP